MIRVMLLVDDHEVVRQGLKAMIDAEEDMEVVVEADTADESGRRAKTFEPDVCWASGFCRARIEEGAEETAARALRWVATAVTAASFAMIALGFGGALAAGFRLVLASRWPSARPARR